MLGDPGGSWLTGRWERAFSCGIIPHSAISPVQFEDQYAQQMVKAAA